MIAKCCSDRMSDGETVCVVQLCSSMSENRPERQEEGGAAGVQEGGTGGRK